MEENMIADYVISGFYVIVVSVFVACILSGFTAFDRTTQKQWNKKTNERKSIVCHSGSNNGTSIELIL